ncbi:MAG: agmatinase family protein [Planctomycetota bacterium]|jgi:agmatinase
MTAFDPDAAADPDAGLFGLETSLSEAQAIVIPVGFDATTSYRTGAAAGPEWIRRASHQVDLHDERWGAVWERGIASLDSDPRIAELQARAFPRARRVIDAGGRVAGDPALEADLAAVDAAGSELNAIVEEHTRSALDAGRLPVVIGGDHSIPFGAIAAAADRHPGMGILHVDAHADLRVAFEGFTWSHASILHNVLERCPGVARLLQIGVRDLGAAESQRIASSSDRISTLFDDRWGAARASGDDLGTLVDTALDFLPDEIWITVDVDGLDPALCPNTGTPVPGGLGWNEMMLWLDRIERSGRRVVGVDLVEVSGGPLDGAQLPPADAPDPWDAIVGARLAYKLIGCALATRG